MEILASFISRSHSPTDMACITSPRLQCLPAPAHSCRTSLDASSQGWRLPLQPSSSSRKRGSEVASLAVPRSSQKPAHLSAKPGCRGKGESAGPTGVLARSGGKVSLMARREQHNTLAVLCFGRQRSLLPASRDTSLPERALLWLAKPPTLEKHLKHPQP